MERKEVGLPNKEIQEQSSEENGEFTRPSLERAEMALRLGEEYMENRRRQLGGKLRRTDDRMSSTVITI